MSEAAQLLYKLKGVFPKSRSSSKNEQSEFPSKIQLTNAIFRLHSHVAFFFLLSSSLLIFVQQLMGVHIKCLMPSSEEGSQDLRTSAVTTYCFVTGTYTLPNSTPNQLHSHPGVGTHIEGEGSQKFHHYFQWVPFILFLECICFCIPHLLWKAWEGQKLARFLDKVENPSHDTDPGTAAKYFRRHLGYNKLYALSFMFSEMLNFLLALGTFWITDWFLQGQFQYFGWEYFNYVMANKEMSHGEREISPLDRIFPKVAKCDFQKFGPSGQVVKYDILCILSSNVINEKIFLGLWAMLILLVLVGIALFLYRFGLPFVSRIYKLIVFILFPTARAYLILKGSMRKDHSSIKFIFNKMKIGYADWFFLKRISDALDSDKFCEFCKDMEKTVQEKSKRNRNPQIEEEEMVPMVVLKRDHGFGNDPTRRRRPIYDDIPSAQDELPDDRSLYDFRAIQEERTSLKRVNGRLANVGSLNQITVHSNDEILNYEKRHGKFENVYS